METVELTVEARLLDENNHNISFELQYLEQISESSDILFRSHLQAGYHVNCVLDANWVDCGEVLNAT